MNRMGAKDIQIVVDDLNERYKLNDFSPCKFYVRTGYGGYRIVLRMNEPYGSAESCVTTNFLPARDCLYRLYEKAFYNEIDSEVEHMIYLAKLYRGRR